MFKRADEMEMQIILKSVRIAWAYSALFLLVWAVYEFVQTQRLGLPFMQPKRCPLSQSTDNKENGHCWK